MVATVFMPSSALALQDSCMPQALHCQWITKLINSAHSLSEHWPEHNAYELGPPEKSS